MPGKFPPGDLPFSDHDRPSGRFSHPQMPTTAEDHEFLAFLDFVRSLTLDERIAITKLTRRIDNAIPASIGS
jgi:hypothetical protein